MLRRGQHLLDDAVHACLSGVNQRFLDDPMPRYDEAVAELPRNRMIDWLHRHPA